MVLAHPLFPAQESFGRGYMDVCATCKTSEMLFKVCMHLQTFALPSCVCLCVYVCASWVEKGGQFGSGKAEWEKWEEW